MKEKKKISFVFVAIFAAFLMASSTTAVNVSQFDAVDKKQKEEKNTNSGCALCAKISKNTNFIKSIVEDDDWTIWEIILYLIIMIPLCLMFPLLCCTMGCQNRYDNCIEEGKDPDLCDFIREDCIDDCYQNFE